MLRHERRLSMYIGGLALLLAFLYAGLQLQSSETRYAALIEKACPSTEDLGCVERFIEDTIGKKGLSEGFKALKSWYLHDPEFRPLCSDLAVQIGADVATKRGVYGTLVIEPISVTCNYAFYQGYTRAFLLSGGDLQEIKRFCDAVGARLDASVPDAKAECYRGIGKVLPFLTEAPDADLETVAAWGTKTCAEIASDLHSYTYCISGAFNGLATKTSQKGSGLVVDIEDPLVLCEKQSRLNRPDCYGNFKRIAMKEFPKNTGLLEIFRSYAGTLASHEALSIAIFSVGYQRAKLHVALDPTYDVVLYDAGTLPSTYTDSYISGFAYGLAKNSTPGRQHEAVLAFCAQAKDTFPSIPAPVCTASALQYLQGFYAPSQFQKVCEIFHRRLDTPCD